MYLPTHHLSLFPSLHSQSVSHLLPHHSILLPFSYQTSLHFELYSGCRISRLDKKRDAMTMVGQEYEHGYGSHFPTPSSPLPLLFLYYAIVVPVSRMVQRHYTRKGARCEVSESGNNHALSWTVPCVPSFCLTFLPHFVFAHRRRESKTNRRKAVELG